MNLHNRMDYKEAILTYALGLWSAKNINLQRNRNSESLSQTLTLNQTSFNPGVRWQSECECVDRARHPDLTAFAELNWLCIGRTPI